MKRLSGVLLLLACFLLLAGCGEKEEKTAEAVDGVYKIY